MSAIDDTSNPLDPTVTTDQADYSPGSVATITASGFGVGDDIDFQIEVIDPATGNILWSGPSWDATEGSDANGNGLLTTSFSVTPAYAGATIELTAIDTVTGQTATTVFTDSLNYDTASGDPPARSAPAHIIDLTTAGATVSTGDAIWEQGAQASATGTLKPFLWIQADNGGGAEASEHGYNTAAGAQLDDQTPPGVVNPVVNVNDLQVVTVNGHQYYEFILSLNQSDGSPGLSLDAVQIFQASSNSLTGTTSADGSGAMSLSLPGATKVFDLEGSGATAVYLDASLTHGQGTGDATLLVPVSDFSLDHTQNPYIYLYAAFGQEGAGYSTNGGSEQWAALESSDPDSTSEAPSLTLGGTSATVAEGGTTTLPGITATAVDSDDTVTVTIAGLPDGASITDSADGHSFSGASITLTQAEAQSTLTLNDRTVEDGSFSLSVTTNNTTGGETASSTAQTINVTVTPVPEGPVLGGATSAEVNEGGAVTFGATTSVSDADDALGNVTITGLPGDLTGVNGGTYDATHGTWTGTAAEFNALAFTAGEDGTYNLTVAATTTGAEAATTTESYTLKVDPVPEGPVLGGATSAYANAGATVTLGATDSVSDSDDTLGNVTITGLPNDLSHFNGGTYNASAGTWTGTAAQFNALTFTAGHTTANLTITATTTGAEAGSSTEHYALDVFPVGLSIGYWYNHQSAWADYSGKAPLLLGDLSGHNSVTDTLSTDWLSTPWTAATQLINSSQSATDTRQILMSQAEGAQLNIDSGAKDPGYSGGTPDGHDLISEAVAWLSGQGPLAQSWSSSKNPGSSVYYDGTIDHNLSLGSITDAADYSTSKGAFTSTALTSSSAAWHPSTLATVLSGYADYNGNANVTVSADGEGLKNALMAFNQDQLVVSSDGSLIGWNTGHGIIDVHNNTDDAFWGILHDANHNLAAFGLTAAFAGIS